MLRQPTIIILADEKGSWNEPRCHPDQCLAHSDGKCTLYLEESSEPIPEESDFVLQAGCRLYQCRGCKRYIPWCFGGHQGDEVLDELCDDCCVSHPRWKEQNAHTDS